MKKMTKRLFLSLLAAAAFVMPATLVAKEKTEAEVLAMLESKNADEVCSAMLNIEKRFSSNESAIKTIRTMLADPRLAVQRKAARVLGVLHTELTGDELKSVYALLKSSDRLAVIDGLKALRGLKAPGAAAEIIPLLQNTDENIVRDSCRTLAEMGAKSAIPSIEPLVSNPNKAIAKDAQEALFKLKQ